MVEWVVGEGGGDVQRKAVDVDVGVRCLYKSSDSAIATGAEDARREQQDTASQGALQLGACADRDANHRSRENGRRYAGSAQTSLVCARVTHLA